MRFIGQSQNPYVQQEMDMSSMMGAMPYMYEDVDYMEGEGLFSSLGKAARTVGRVGSKAAKAAVKTVKYASKVGKKYVKKAKEFYKKNKKEIDATVKGIKDVADATGLTGLALRKATEFAKEKGLIPEPPEEVEEAAEEIADDEIEEEIEGGSRERCEGHFTGGSAAQIAKAMEKYVGGATRLPVLAYEQRGGRMHSKLPPPVVAPVAPKPKIDREAKLREARAAYEAAAKAARSAPVVGGGAPSRAEVIAMNKAKSLAMLKERQEAARARLSASKVVGGRKPSGRKPSARAAIVKQVMAERGVSLPEASRIVKEEGLY
jgi:hypothetical protein